MSKLLDNIYAKVVGGGALPFYETLLRRRNTFRYLKEFEKTQWLPQDQLSDLQWERLKALLNHAYSTVSYYRNLFDEAGIHPDDIKTPADFARLPILDKAIIRAHSEGQMISSAFDRNKMTKSATGGSTGEPVQFYFDRNSYERRMSAAMRGRLGRMEPVRTGVLHLGSATSPRERIDPVEKLLHHKLLRRHAVNSFELSAEKIDTVIQKFNTLQPRVVVGYANAVYEFAKYVKKTGRPIHSPEGIIVSAEKVYDHQREMIEEVFRAPVQERYGCREVMMIGAECSEHNGLHVTADNLYVEIVRDGQPCEPGEVGEVLLTDLHNYGMPLIRYKVGDLAAWKGQDCPCGRGLPLIKSVEGRSLDVISTPGGRVISGVFFPHFFKDFPAIRTFQVVQEKKEELSIRLALDEPLSPSDRSLLERTVIQTVGPEMKVNWEVGQDVVIQRERKFRPVVSHVPADFSKVTVE